MSLLEKVKSGVVMLAVVLSSGLFAAEPEYSIYNLRPGVTETSQQVFDLHMLVVYIMFVVAALVFGAILYTVIRFRKAKNPNPSKFSHSTTVEIIWTVVPMIILIYLAIPAGELLLKIEDDSDADMTVKITGLQWKWKYTYMDDDIEFYSSLSTPREQYVDYDGNAAEKGASYLLEVDNELVLPMGKKIRFLLASDDVIHSWWVPDLAVKMDAIPGFINQTWTEINPELMAKKIQAGGESVLRGVCAELCGKDHGFMPVVVKPVTEAEYKKWVAQKQAEKAEAARLAAEAAAKNWSMDDLMAKGKEIYDAKCAMCHQINGEGLGAFPALKDSPIIVNGTADEHARLVIFGINAMPKFGDQLTDAELAAVVTYERNAWGNDKGDLIQPARISELKAGQ